jgi:hypothetical protein
MSKRTFLKIWIRIRNAVLYTFSCFTNPVVFKGCFVLCLAKQRCHAQVLCFIQPSRDAMFKFCTFFSQTEMSFLFIRNNVKKDIFKKLDPDPKRCFVHIFMLYKPCCVQRLFCALFSQAEMPCSSFVLYSAKQRCRVQVLYFFQPNRDVMLKFCALCSQTETPC